MRKISCSRNLQVALLRRLKPAATSRSFLCIFSRLTPHASRLILAIACCLLLLLAAGCGSSSSTPAPGAISVSAQNSSGGSVSASVLLNSESKGTAPLEVKELTPGTYTLLLQSQGYNDYTTSVVVQSGQTTSVTATMETIPVPEGPAF